MICRLCLKDILEVINIFDEIGIERNVAGILKTHFWFEPTIDDPISTAICNDCWLKVFNFHEYYLSVEKAHRLLGDRSFVKASSPLVEADDDANIQKDEPVIKDDDVLPWDMMKVNFTYPLLEEECDFPFNNGLVVESIEDTKEDIKDVDIKPPAEEIINKSDCSLSLRSKTISRVKISPDPPTTKAKKKQKKESGSKDPESESEYTKRAKEHDALIARNLKIVCDLCNSESTDFIALCQHFLNTHDQKGYIYCCNKKFFKRTLLVDHINKHLDPDFFKCKSCQKVFSSSHSLKTHILRIHQVDEEKPFKCEHCTRRFMKHYLLQQHQVIHVPMEERKFSCDICSKAFPTKNILSTHHKNTHLREHDRICHICAKVIRGRAMFEKHQLEHKGVREPKIQCEKCGAWSKTKRSLQKHMQRHNDDGNTHTCKICGKTSPNRIALLSHVRYVHTSVRLYECNFCDKSFKKSISLKEHMASHTGEVLYTCPLCPKTFNSHSNMHSHGKKVHTSDWEANKKNRRDKVAGRSSLTVQNTTDGANEVMVEDKTAES